MTSRKAATRVQDLAALPQNPRVIAPDALQYSTAAPAT